MWLILAITSARADDCLPTGEAVEQAWAEYNDAEVDQAKAILQEAYEALPCQAEVVSPSQLLDLYRLDALVSITQSDQKGAVYATLRAVAAQHEGARPPETYGPMLAELYDTWSQRMGGALVTVSVSGGGEVFVDGRSVAPSTPLQVAEGEHLVQIDDGEAVRSEVVDVAGDHTVTTGLPGPALVPAPAPEPEPELPPFAAPPVPVAPVAPVTPAPSPAEPSRGRRRPVWAFAGAALAGGGAAFALGSAYVSESRFLQDPYTGLGAARTDTITKDAQAIRLAYGFGYGLAAISGGLLTVGVIGLPASGGPRGALGLSGRW